MTPDTPSHYGTISRALHWSMAVAIACMYLLAVAWRVSGHTETLIPVHKALGTLLLILVFARILWAVAAEQRPRATSLAARLGHLALYLRSRCRPSPSSATLPPVVTAAPKTQRPASATFGTAALPGCCSCSSPDTS